VLPDLALLQSLHESRYVRSFVGQPEGSKKGAHLVVAELSEKLKVETQSVVDYLADMSRADIPAAVIEVSDEGESVH
jgi:hypothetical protein